MTREFPTLAWQEADAPQHARWRSEAGNAPPKRVVIADDRMAADVAYRLACEGTALLWRGDFQNARQLLQAMGRRNDQKPDRKARKGAAAAASSGSTPSTTSTAHAFHAHRQAQGQRARTLGMLLLPMDGDYGIPLRRAPDVTQACTEAYGEADGTPSVVSMREVLGLIGAHEWRKKGVPIAALNDRIHPWYGVFAPVRGEYIQLVHRAPLPTTTLAFDIGTGTGVLAAVLARRGVAHVVATDQDPRALACATENLLRLGHADTVDVIEADLFPAGQAPLIVCNPPWVPARPSSPIEYAVYDPDSRMLRGFLAGLRAHLTPGGEGWLILSDLAEHLGLRSRVELESWIADGGLTVLGRIDTRPQHGKASDPDDPLHAARSVEVTSLWRLGAA